MWETQWRISNNILYYIILQVHVYYIDYLVLEYSIKIQNT